jgi:hypothetical protein
LCSWRKSSEGLVVRCVMTSRTTVATGPSAAAAAAPTTLPNLFTIGAAKCGTTSLHYYLDQHPSISMSSVKEPGIFSAPDWRDQLQRYATMLDPGAPIRGESSTQYTKYPTFPDVPARIASVVPDARLIYVVRDPVSRCISQWVHNVAAGRESRTLTVALRNLDDPDNTYVWCGRYGTQIELYLEHFPRESLLVLDQADLLGNRPETLRRVFGYLGVDDAFHSPRFDAELNSGDTRRQLGALGARLRRSRAMVVYRRLPLRWRPAIDSVRRRLLPPVPKPELDPALRADLEALYEDELDRLAALTGTRPATAWSPLT